MSGIRSRYGFAGTPAEALDPRAEPIDRGGRLETTQSTRRVRARSMSRKPRSRSQRSNQRSSSVLGPRAGFDRTWRSSIRWARRAARPLGPVTQIGFSASLPRLPGQETGARKDEKPPGRNRARALASIIAPRLQKAPAALPMARGGDDVDARVVFLQVIVRRPQKVLNIGGGRSRFRESALGRLESAVNGPRRDLRETQRARRYRRCRDSVSSTSSAGPLIGDGLTEIVPG
jgi:hypothetical protein